MSTETELTPERVREMVARLVAPDIEGDDESQHAEEDEMRQEVLLAIAEGRASDAAAVATEALKSSALRFSRWCA